MNDISVLTIGHSTHTYERFLALLVNADITAVADVRTTPHSRHFPHFNKNTLRDKLRESGIAYVFLGEELGGRPSRPELYCDGVADYEKMAKTDSFYNGINRVIEGGRKFRLALMCSEQDPLDCHRCLLVGRALHEKGIRVLHIYGNGDIVDQHKIENQLLILAGKSDNDLFEETSVRLASAYRRRSLKIAFTESISHASSPGEDAHELD